MFELSIAYRYLRAKKKEGFASIVAVFSFLGIMLGVATLVVVMAVMNGVKSELINRIIGINAHISVNSPTGKIQDYAQLAEKIKKVKGVEYANAAIYGQSLASVNGQNIGVVIHGIDSFDLSNKKLIAENIKYGEIYNDGEFQAIAGIQLAKKMGMSVGSSVSLISPSFNQTLFGGIPRMKQFAISGVFDVGMFEYDSSVLFTSLESAQKFFSMEKTASIIEIQVSDPKNLGGIKEEILKLINKNGYYIVDWREANSGFLESIDVQANVLFLILALIIIVAAFNVISGMVMLVNDKNKEIAILRTIGLKRRSIIRIFIICGASIGVAGTAFGVALGLAFAANIDAIKNWLEHLTHKNLFSAEIYFLSKLPAEVRMDDVVHITALSLVISLLSTLYPSWKASKIEPAEALKYE